MYLLLAVEGLSRKDLLTSTAVQVSPVVGQSQSKQHVPIHEPPMTKEELDEQKEKTFQLQALLGDASPQVRTLLPRNLSNHSMLTS